MTYLAELANNELVDHKDHVTIGTARKIARELLAEDVLAKQDQNKLTDYIFQNYNVSRFTANVIMMLVTH